MFLNCAKADDVLKAIKDKNAAMIDAVHGSARHVAAFLRSTERS
jgi:hypothetical protein